MTCVGLYDCIWFDRVKVTDKFNGRVSNLSVYASMVTFIWTYGVTTRERRERGEQVELESQKYQTSSKSTAHSPFTSSCLMRNLWIQCGLLLG